MKYLLLIFLPCLAFAQSVETYQGLTSANVSRGGVEWSGGTASVTEGGSSDWLVTSGFGFSIPVEATIDSLSVSVALDYSGSPADVGAVSLFSVEPIGSLKAENEPWESTLLLSGDATYWGTDLTPELVNSLSVGIWGYADHAEDLILGAVDATVYYTVPAGPSRGGTYAAIGKGALVNRAYNAGTNDTTQAIQTGKSTFLTLASKDSASLTIKYQLSLDGVNWGALTTTDSLSTANDNGDAKSLNVDNIALGAPFVRFTFSQNPSFRLGKTSATYTARVVQK